MILYRPIDGDVYSAPTQFRPKTCFLMMQLGDPKPLLLSEVRSKVSTILRKNEFDTIDADSQTTGRDFLMKIWELAISVPLGIAIVHEDISQQTMANIFYELGWMQALGKETLVIKCGDAPIPSDFVRTEYVPYDGNFERRFKRFIDSLKARADYYLLMADQLENNPLLSIDYLRRAYLLTGNLKLRTRAQKIHASAGLEDRARNSVERLLVSF